MSELNSECLALIINSIVENCTSTRCNSVATFMREKNKRRTSILSALAAYSVKKPRKKKTVLTKSYVEVIRSFSDAVFINHFQMRRQCFSKLLSEVKRNWPSSGKGRPSVNAQTALYVTQWGLSNENSLRKISQRFSLSIGLIHNTIMKTCKILAGLTTKYILWPKEEELNTLTNRFRQLFQPTGFPSVIGCVGVTPILISSAIDSYYNSEGFSSIILQGICDSNLIFRNVYFGCPGGSKTAAVWYSSPVGISLACGELLLPKNSYLLGDATYPLKQYLITPYQNDGLLLKRQQCFNSIHKTTLACIEKAFKNLKSKLKYLNHLHLKKLTNAKFIVLSCVVVHNFIILNSSDLNAAIFEESNINVLKPEETISIVPDNDDIQLGKLRRDELCDWIHQ